MFCYIIKSICVLEYILCLVKFNCILFVVVPSVVLLLYYIYVAPSFICYCILSLVIVYITLYKSLEDTVRLDLDRSNAYTVIMIQNGKSTQVIINGGGDSTIKITQGD